MRAHGASMAIVLTCAESFTSKQLHRSPFPLLASMSQRRPGGATFAQAASASRNLAGERKRS